MKVKECNDCGGCGCEEHGGQEQLRIVGHSPVCSECGGNLFQIVYNSQHRRLYAICAGCDGALLEFVAVMLDPEMEQKIFENMPTVGEC